MKFCELKQVLDKNYRHKGLGRFLLYGFAFAVGSFIVGMGFNQANIATPPSVVAVLPEPSGALRFDSPAPLPISANRMARVAQIISNPTESCLVAGDDNGNSDGRQALSEIFRTVGKIDSGASLLQVARDRRVLVCFDRSTDLMAYYRAGMRLIGLSPHLERGEMISYLAHELAHVPQHSVYSDNRYFSTRDLILLRRIREATAEAIATQIAWKLHHSGHSAAWNIKRGDPFYGDIALAFEVEMQRSKSGTQMTRATKAAFDTWFMRPARLDIYDRMTIEHLQRISSDRLGLVPPRRFLEHGFLIGLAPIGIQALLAHSPELALTDPFYSGSISQENLVRLQEILESNPQLHPPDGVSDAAVGRD